MQVTLKQSDIIKGIALFLKSIGMATVNAADLTVDFSITRKDNAGLIATFDIPERETFVPACATAEVTEEVSTRIATDAVVVDSVEPVVEPVAEAAPVVEDAVAEPVVEAEPVVAGEAQADSGKVSLFG